MNIEHLKRRMISELMAYERMEYDPESDCVQRCKLILELIEENEKLKEQLKKLS